jgi:hypothetical protein
MSEWATHSEELNRKAIEVLSGAIYRNSEGTLDDKGLHTVAETLATVTQGLIPKETWELIYAVQKEIET